MEVDEADVAKTPEKKGGRKPKKEAKKVQEKKIESVIFVEGPVILIFEE